MSGTAADQKWAFRRGTAWGTAVQIAAEDEILISSENLSGGVPEDIADENVGDSLSQGSMQGNVVAQGDFKQTVRYLGFERLLALFMGADAVTETEAGIAYEHVMPFKPTNDGYYGTMINDGGLGGARIWERPSLKLTKLDLNHEESKLMAGWGTVFDQVLRGASAANDQTNLDAATAPSRALMAIFQQVQVLLKQITGAEGNLAPGDEFLVTNAQITLDRKQTGDYESGSNAGRTGEPTNNGFPEAKLILTMARYKDQNDDIAQLAQAQNADREPAKYKAQVIWTGRSIPGTATAKKYRLAWDFPHLIIPEDFTINVPGPGQKIPVTIPFNIKTPQEAVNGSDWAWVVAGADPFRARLQNSEQTAGIAQGG
jgi:hypothetical protein